MSDYEAEQVRQIALWKSEIPSLLLESYHDLARPISKLITHVAPRGLVRKVLQKVEALAEPRRAADDILKASGASRVAELRGRSLEECDQLARMVSIRAEHLALLEGVAPAIGGVAIPGVGGALTAMVDVPLLLEASLRAVRRIGHCYGFPLDSDADRRFVLAILDIANEDTPAGLDEERLGLWAPGGPVEWVHDGAEPLDTIERSMVDDLPLESIPIVGDLTNLVLDYAFVRRADVTARRVFQERWLRENGKVESIPPVPGTHRRSSIEGVQNLSSEVAYVLSYGVSFGVTFSAVMVGSIAASVAPGSVRRGFADGASVAARDSQRLLDGLGRANGKVSREATVPALV